MHSLVLGHNLTSCPLIPCISSFVLQIANYNPALSPFGRCYWKKLHLIFPASKAQLSLALEIVMNLHIGWLMFVFLSLEKCCSSKPWFSLLRFTPVAFPWSSSTLPSFVLLFELTRQIAPPTKNGHAPSSLTELGKSSPSVNFQSQSQSWDEMQWAENGICSTWMWWRTSLLWGWLRTGTGFPERL